MPFVYIKKETNVIYCSVSFSENLFVFVESSPISILIQYLALALIFISVTFPSSAINIHSTNFEEAYKTAI